MRIVAAVVLVLLGTVSVRAAESSPWASLAEPVFMRVDTRELPEGVVETIAQDATGFLWVGTQGGLARYDGYHFTRWLPNPDDPKGLPDGYIRTLFAGTNALWIGTDSNGLVRFDTTAQTFTTWRADPRGRHGPRSATIYAIARGSNGALWIGGDNGLDSFAPSTHAWTPVPLPSRGTTPPAVFSVLIDRAGTVWVGTHDGLYRRPPAAKRFVRFTDPSAPRDALQPVRELYEDRAGNLWAGSSNAVYVLNSRRRVVKIFRSSPDDATTIAPGPQVCAIEPTPGTMWIGSSDGGLSIVDTATWRVQRVTAVPDDPVGLSAGRVVGFIRDRSGLIWLADHSGGLLLYNPLSRGAYAYSRARTRMGDTGATALAFAGGKLWIGGARGTLVGLAPNALPVHRRVPTGSLIAGLGAGSHDTLWIGTFAGLCSLAPPAPVRCANEPLRLERVNVVWTLLETAGALWVGTDVGLFVRDRRTGTVTRYRRGNGPHGLTSGLIGATYPDRAGYMWIGTANGLNRMDMHTRRVARFTFDPHDANSLGPGSVESILQDRRGRLWIAMNGGPLNVLDDPDGTPRFHRLGRANGLPHENVDGLEQDPNGRIWASTDAGMALIDPTTLRARPFGLADGTLGSNYWGGSQAQAPDGTMFFGSSDGVSVIAPGATSPWTYAPPVVLTSLKVDERSVPLTNDVTLEPGARDVTAEFAALDYSDPAALQYQYELQGYDRAWIHTDTLHRTATYTNLPPGRYVLRVRATNRLGVWSTHDLAVRIDALPAWYETWWFRLFLAIAAVLAIFGIMQLRTAALRQRAQALEELVRDRTRALEEASLRDPLTGLRNRRFLTQTIEQDAMLALRSKTDLLFFMIDIDHFKQVNDTFGHHAGDLVLVQMRERLQQVFRESDYLVRWGGEEFLAVARGSSRADAPEIAERIRTEVANRPFDLGGGKSLAKTVSIGVAAFPLDPAQPQALDWQQTIELADRALYAAKQSGRNAWREAPQPAPAT